MSRDERRDEQRIRKFTFIIIAYPCVLILISGAVNLFVFGVAPGEIALPSMPIVSALVGTAILLVANHSWLMTSTELTRLKFNMHATPEERDMSDAQQEEAPQQGRQELERRHNAHRNTTENTVYFILLAFIFSLISPSPLAAQIWLIGFAGARLGYTFSYLSAMSGARGVFMSLSLLCIYGLASYLVMSLLV